MKHKALSTKRPNIERSRIAALSIAIAVHSAAVLWLSLPISRPEALPNTEMSVKLEFIPNPGSSLTLTPPTPPPPPRQAPKAAPSKPEPEVPDSPKNKTEAQIVHEEGQLPMEVMTLSTVLASPDEFSDLELPAPDQPASEILSYRTSHPPAYPPESKAAGESGWVIVRVLVDATGHPITFVLVNSTAPDRLIVAAIDAIKLWRFNPATKEGRPVPAWVEVPIGFYNSNQPATGGSSSPSGVGGSP